MANLTTISQQIINSSESKDLLSTINGEMVSTERQLKNGTLVYKEPDNKKWLIYPNGYIRVDRPGSDRLSQVYKPDGKHDYDNMGINYYTKFAIPLLKEKILNIKNREIKRWEKLSDRGKIILPAFFEIRNIQRLVVDYYNGRRDFNNFYTWLNKLKS